MGGVPELNELVPSRMIRRCKNHAYRLCFTALAVLLVGTLKSRRTHTGTEPVFVI